MEYWAIAVSLISLLLTILGYYRHDKKIKEQEVKINEYQIEKHQKDEEQAKKAIINMWCEKEMNINRIFDYYIKVENIGKSLAKNLVVEIPKLEGIHEGEYQKSIDLRPGKKFQIPVDFAINAPRVFTVNVSWEDEFQKNNVDKQQVFIP